MRHAQWLLALMLCWTVQAQPGRVIDGDTFIAKMPIWMGITVEEHIRILGVDTPEMRGSTRQVALKAKDFTVSWLSRGPVTVTTCRRDSFGRVLGTVTRGTENLATDLIDAKLGCRASAKGC